MTRTNLAALALLPGVTIAAPAVICSAADSEMQTAQAQTTAQPPSDQPAQDTPGMGGMRGMMGREGMGPMGHRMREMMNRSPKDRCEERLARRAGFIAYTVAKLNLTAQQKPLWDKLNASMQRSKCEREVGARLVRLPCNDTDRKAVKAMPAPANPRIAVLGFSIECNKFAPPATKAHFAARTYLEGEAILDEARRPTPTM